MDCDDDNVSLQAGEIAVPTAKNEFYDGMEAENAIGLSNQAIPRPRMKSELDKINDNLEGDDDDDNLSLEVNYDGDSCRASDVSSISFQNFVLDDPDYDLDPVSNQLEPSSLKDSISESSDSPLHDFISEIEDQVYKREFENDVTKRESIDSVKRRPSVGGGECESNDDFHFDSSNEISTLKRQNNPANAPLSTNIPTAFKSALTSPSLASNHIGDGLKFKHTNNSKKCNDRHYINGTFQKMTLQSSGASSDAERYTGQSTASCDETNFEKSTAALEAQVLASFGAVDDSTKADLRNIIASNTAKVNPPEESLKSLDANQPATEDSTGVQRKENNNTSKKAVAPRKPLCETG